MKHLLAAGAALLWCGALGAQFNPNEPIRTLLIQNDTLLVTHLRFVPGTREQLHSHSFPIAIIQVSAGDLTVQEQGVMRKSQRVGEVWYVPTGRPHAVTTVAGGSAPIDVLTVALLPTRPPAPPAPVTEAPPGITRATLVDNNDLRIVRVRFSPNAREPLHSHPNDLLTIQITRGKVHIVNGPEDTTADREPGFIQFLPRNVQHWFGSADTQPFELLSVAVK